MFQNAATDVVIGLILMYLMLSLLCTVINEFIASQLKLRSKSLASALEKLLDVETLRATFYRHGQITTNKSASAIGSQSIVSAVRNITSRPTPAPAQLAAAASGSASVAIAQAPAADKEHPSYLSGRSVALALIGSLDPKKPLPGITDIQIAVESLPPSHIRDILLSSLTEAGNDLDKLRTSIATWFDDSMERLSGAYKRQLKWISMLIGLVVTIAFNADSFNVATTLWKDQELRASVFQIAIMKSKETPSNPPESVTDAIKNTENTLRALPIGWNCTVTPPATHGQVTQTYWECAKARLSTVTPKQVLGWILTTAALTLGAPFWFDLLQKFVNIRGAGGKPKREDEKKASP